MEHGKEYQKRRKIKDYEQFMRDYAISNTPNGLEAIMTAEEDLREQILSALDVAGQLPMVLRHEKSAEVIANWLLGMVLLGIPLAHNVLAILAQKIEEADDLSCLSEWMSAICDSEEEYGRTLWNLLDHNKLKGRVEKTGQAVRLIMAINHASYEDEDLAQEILGLLSAEGVARGLNEEESPYQLAEYIEIIYHTNEEVGRNVWELMDKENLAAKLSRPRDIVDARMCLYKLFHTVEQGMAYEICALLNVEELTRVLDGVEEFWEIGRYLSWILDSNEIIGQKVWNYLNKVGLAVKLCRTLDVEKMDEWSDGLRSFQEEKASEICNLLSVEEIVAKLNLAEDPELAILALCTILDVDQQVGRNIWDALDKKNLATKLSQLTDIEKGKKCVEQIYDTDSSMGQELCLFIEAELLVQTLDQSEDIGAIGEYIAILLRRNRKVGERIWELLDKENITGKLCRTADIGAAQSLIKCTVLLGRGTAQELGCFLDATQLAEKLDESDDVTFIVPYLRLILKINREIGRKVWQLMDKKSLGNKVSQIDYAFSGAGYLKDVYSADPNMASELCGFLDLSEVAAMLNQVEVAEHAAMYISTVMRANRKIGEKIWELLDKERLAMEGTSNGSLWFVMSGIEAFYSADPDMAHELCALMDIHKVASILKKEKNSKDVKDYLGIIGKANEDVRQKLEILLDK